MKIKLWVKRLALVSVTLFVALLAAELVVRMVVWVPRGTPFVAENPDTIYITKPNISGRHISPGEFNYPFQTSSLGFRSAELGAGPAVAPRILCLGDSFTFGVGASDPETWPAQLEARLNSSGKKIEVVNAGVIGWGLAEYWVWTSNQAAKLAPSLIVVGCQAGDWRNAYYGLVSMDAEGKLQRHQVIRKDVSQLKAIVRHIPFYDTLMTHSALANLLKQAVVRITRKGTVVGMAGTVGRVEQIAPINKALLTELKHRAADMGASLLVVFIPYADGMDPTGYDAAYGRFRELVQTWTQELAIPYVDATPLLQRHLKRHSLSVSGLYYKRDGHSTPLGYTVIAEGVSEAVLQHPEWLTGNHQSSATNR